MASILTCYYRPKPGGFCSRLFRAINALLDNGHTVHYLSVVPFPISSPNLYHHRFPWPASMTHGYLFWSIFFSIAPFLIVYIGLRYRISSFFAFSCSYGYLFQPVRMLTQKPLSIFVRGDAIQHYALKGYPKIVLKIESLLEAFAIRKVRLYPVSKTLLDRVLGRHRFFNPVLSDVLPNDIPDLNISKDSDITKKTSLCISCVGILEKIKNQETIINAIAKSNNDNICLKLYGSGPDEAYLKKIVDKLGLVDKIRFMGWIENPEIIWAHTDVLIYPSLNEGAPNTVLEAISCRIPVIASDIPEHRELLPAESLVCKDDVDSWARLFSRVFSPPFRSLVSLQESQAVFAEKLRFDWDQKISGLITS